MGGRFGKYGDAKRKALIGKNKLVRKPQVKKTHKRRIKPNASLSRKKRLLNGFKKKSI